jgi:hypothetical protein
MEDTKVNETQKWSTSKRSLRTTVLSHDDFLHGYSSTLKMDSTCSCETSVDFQRTTRRYIPEHRTLQCHSCLSQKDQWQSCSGG